MKINIVLCVLTLFFILVGDGTYTITGQRVE